MKCAITIGLLLLCTFADAQLEVDKKLEFTSGDAGRRQVYGLAYPASSDHASNVYAVQSGQLIAASSNDADTLILTFSPALSAYTTGMRLVISMGAPNTGALWINADGLGVKAVQKVGNQPLAAGEILAATTFSVVYDGTAFQLTAAPSSTCPAGFVNVNGSYCIQQDENSAMLFWDANQHCASLNARVCSWGDWYYACQKPALGLSNMTNNLEWVDDADDHASHASTVGNGSCTQNATSNTLVIPNSHSFRCCYYK